MPGFCYAFGLNMKPVLASGKDMGLYVRVQHLARTLSTKNQQFTTKLFRSVHSTMKNMETKLIDLPINTVNALYWRRPVWVVFSLWVVGNMR